MLEPNYHLVSHPLTDHLIGLMRNKSCPRGQFSHFMRQLSQFLFYEALLIAQPKMFGARCETVVEEAPGRNATANIHLIDGGQIALVGIMRAGIPMLESVHQFLPNAVIGHLGIQRNHAEDTAEIYFKNFPPLGGKTVLLFEPMIAGGKTVREALKQIFKPYKNNSHEETSPDDPPPNEEDVVVVSIICTQRGMDRIHSKYPKVRIITAAIDPVLNSYGEIVPGLGSIGNIVYGTNSSRSILTDD